MKVVSRISLLILFALATTVLSAKGCGGGESPIPVTTTVHEAPQVAYEHPVTTTVHEAPQVAYEHPVAAGCGAGQAVTEVHSVPVQHVEVPVATHVQHVEVPVATHVQHVEVPVATQVQHVEVPVAAGCGSQVVTQQAQPVVTTQVVHQPVYTTQVQAAPVATACTHVVQEAPQVITQVQPVQQVVSHEHQTTGCSHSVEQSHQVVSHVQQAPAQQVVYTQPAGGCATGGQQVVTYQAPPVVNQQQASQTWVNGQLVNSSGNQALFTQHEPSFEEFGGCGAGQVHSVIAAQEPMVISSEVHPATTLTPAGNTNHY